jgi:hypothetical protein
VKSCVSSQYCSQTNTKTAGCIALLRRPPRSDLIVIKWLIYIFVKAWSCTCCNCGIAMETTHRDCTLFSSALIQSTSFGKIKNSYCMIPKNGAKWCLSVQQCNDENFQVCKMKQKREKCNKRYTRESENFKDTSSLPQKRWDYWKRCLI